MELNKLSKVELELLSYGDLTELILKENKCPMNTPSIFKKICDLLEYTENEYTAKIGDYYTSLTIDKRFVFLNGEWDLKQNHAIPLEIDEDEESEDEIDDELEDVDDDEDELEEELDEDENIDAIDDTDDLIDDDDDDIDDLAIIDEDDEELEKS